MAKKSNKTAHVLNLISPVKTEEAAPQEEVQQKPLPPEAPAEPAPVAKATPPTVASAPEPAPTPEPATPAPAAPSTTKESIRDVLHLSENTEPISELIKDNLEKELEAALMMEMASAAEDALGTTAEMAPAGAEAEVVPIAGAEMAPEAENTPVAEEVPAEAENIPIAKAEKPEVTAKTENIPVAEEVPAEAEDAPVAEEVQAEAVTQAAEVQEKALAYEPLEDTASLEALLSENIEAYARDNGILTKDEDNIGDATAEWEAADILEERLIQEQAPVEDVIEPEVAQEPEAMVTPVTEDIPAAEAKPEEAEKVIEDAPAQIAGAEQVPEVEVEPEKAADVPVTEAAQEPIVEPMAKAEVVQNPVAEKAAEAAGQAVISDSVAKDMPAVTAEAAQEPVAKGKPEEAPKEMAEQAKEEEAQEPGTELRYINVYEQLVEQLATEYIEKFGLCDCRHCRLDVIALTLTNLPAKYIVSDQAEATLMLDFYARKYHAQIITELVKACLVVQKNPHHKK